MNGMFKQIYIQFFHSDKERFQRCRDSEIQCTIKLPPLREGTFLMTPFQEGEGVKSYL